ncbi:MAG: hypothetical protein EYC62_01455 [Alphaproteobacteria bacterium]|nr:MAG: hypothetical protein EYC62_01455 [Alphaproteobacteria bacterium]
MLRFLRVSILFLGILLAPFLAHAADVSASMQNDTATIQFDLDQDSGYTAKLAGGSLIVRFEQPQNIEPRKIKPALKALVSEAILSGDKKTLIVGLTHPVAVLDEKVGKTITITLLPPSAAATMGDGKKPAKPPKPVLSAGTVKIRAARHPDFYRTVYEWPEKVGYHLEEQGRHATVEFEAIVPIPSQELNKIKIPDCEMASPIVSTTTTKIQFECKDSISIRHYAKETTVVLDFAMPPPAAPVKKPEAAAEPAPEAQKAEAKPVEPPKPEVPVDPKEEAKFALPSVDLNPQAEVTPPPEQVPPPLVEEVPDDPLEVQNVELVASKTSTVLSFKAVWPKSVGVSIFKRAGFAWMVFDRPATITMNPETQSVLNIIGGMEIVKGPTSTALRIHTVTGLEPTVQASPDRKIWQIDYKSQKIRPAVTIPAEYKEFADRQFGLYLTVPSSGRVMQLTDPEVGDQIIVATVNIPGRGVNGERNFSEFALLPSAQGIAVVPKVSDIEIRPDFDGFMVVKKSGVLLLAQNKPVEVTDPNKANQKDVYGPWVNEGPPSNPAILKYAEWRGDPKKGFFDKEQDLLAELGKFKPEERLDRRMDLAKLYYSYGWMAEAIAVLNVNAQWDETLARGAEFLAIRGSAYIIEQNYKQATEDLKDQRFDEQPDIATWRAVLAVQQNDWAASDQYFTMSDEPNDAPPANAKKMIGLAQIESEINNNHLDQAKTIIDRLDKDAELVKMHDILNYWRGEIAMRETKPEEAVKLWEGVVKNEEPYARPRAEFALIKYGESTGELKREDIIARLERLRFAWRGDKFEFNVLQMLGRMQIEDGLYREGLFTLRRAVTNYADQPYVVELTDMMTDTFKKLFMEGAADNMPPLTALGLFDEFRDLTPTGPDGDKIIQRLVDRLIAVDLLERAADLLSHQVNYRLQGEDKARVGAKLAFVYIADRKPVEAVKALDLSNAPQIPAELAAERRLLKARALFDQNKPQEALDLIAAEKSREADMLRTDIYWRMRNWGMVAEKLNRLIVESLDDEEKQRQQSDQPAPAEPAKLSPQVAQWVLNLAIAAALDGDDDALKHIKRSYWARMKTLPQFEAFEIITSVDANEPLSLAELTGKLDEAVKYENFMTFYKEKIKKGTFAIN